MEVLCLNNLALSSTLHRRTLSGKKLLHLKSSHKTPTAPPQRLVGPRAAAPRRSIHAKVSARPVNAPAAAAAVPKYTPDELVYEVGKLIPNKDVGVNVTVDLGEYVREIEGSKVYDVAVESPLEREALLSDEDDLGVSYWLKRDDQQSVFSFKLRGAYNMMSKLSEEELERGVITASAGNHAQGVALAAQRLGCTAIIVMPETTPCIKKQAVERLGGTIDPHGQSFDEARLYALERAEKENLVFIPPYDDREIVVGQGTVALEIAKQAAKDDDLHAIFVPIGGGGLVSGIAVYMRALFPDVKIIGVEPSGACGMALSFQKRERVELEYTDTYADGVAVALVGEVTYDLCKQLVDGVVVVEDKDIAEAIRDVYFEKRSILEFSGALALAGAKAYRNYGSQAESVRGKNLVAVASGANLDFPKLVDVVDMAGPGCEEEAVLATKLPEQLGSFKRFCELVRPLNISELKYRYDSSKEKALIQYSVTYHAQAELDAMLERLRAAQLETVNVSDQNLFLRHLKYLVGGGQSKVENELLCWVKLPDGPGAFLKLLNALDSRWNVTLAHFKSKGSVEGNVLVGIQASEPEKRVFRDLTKSIGYPCKFYPKHESLEFLIG